MHLYSWFFTQDVNEYAFAVLCYIKTCVETSLGIRILPNRKPWMSAAVPAC